MFLLAALAFTVAVTRRAYLIGQETKSAKEALFAKQEASRRAYRKAGLIWRPEFTDSLP